MTIYKHMVLERKIYINPFLLCAFDTHYLSQIIYLSVVISRLFEFSSIRHIICIVFCQSKISKGKRSTTHCFLVKLFFKVLFLRYSKSSKMTNEEVCLHGRTFSFLYSFFLQSRLIHIFF